MKIDKITLNEIKPATYNPRIMSIEEQEKLEKNLQEFGLVDPIIINLKNNQIIGGHQRYKILQKEQEKTGKQKEFTLIQRGDIGWVFLDEDMYINDENHEKALNLALNKISGQWDTNKLQSLLEEITLTDLDVELTGFDNIDYTEINETTLDEILHTNDNTIHEPQKTVEEDNYTEKHTQTIETNIKQGDLYKLGNHKLICGDCTKKETLTKLIQNNKIDCLITDPPYGVDYNNKNEFLNKYDKGNLNQTPILNDAIDDYKQFFTKVLQNIKQFLNDYNTVYIFMIGMELHNLRISIDETGYKFSQYLIWLKNNHVLSRRDYQPKTEYCLYGWYNHHKFYGEFNTDVLEFPRPQKSKLHPTMKPIPLISKLIQNSTKEKMNILDVFGGSGTTLIACEQLNRNCYMIELSPEYCQTIINRWEEYTGQTAEKIV